MTGLKPALNTAGGTSDARFIKDYCPVVDFGLVNATIHAVDERAAVEDLDALSRIYEEVLRPLFRMKAANRWRETLAPNSMICH